ncbi:MAG: type I-MYXAN CRISPR-associated protein Cas6/Cmx6 [Gammaproteobacteria bacterium]|nr:type I-MYXAN CRISPR-associated protein Cas6/Cmx6 [Gammaproteobacteria bacterium]
MFWQEEKETIPAFVVPDDIVDLSFALGCKCLPMDHAYALSEALQRALPWLAEEADVGLHLIHGAESGNGWYRPEETEDAIIYLSRRTRMSLRLSKERIDAAAALQGTVLDIAGHPLEIGAPTVRKLCSLPTLFARHVIADADLSEPAFLEQAAAELRNLDIRVTKLMCGMSHTLRGPDGVTHTRSVMVADLDPEQSVRLQQSGIGPGRKIGCGLFIPHKGIKPVRETQ